MSAFETIARRAVRGRDDGRAACAFDRGPLASAGLDRPEIGNVSYQPRDRGGLGGRGSALAGFERRGCLYVPVWIALGPEMPHIDVVGPTGTGKTRWMTALALGALAAGVDVVVLDPQGGLADNLERWYASRLRGGDRPPFGYDCLAPFGPCGFVPPLDVLGATPDDLPDELVVGDVAAALAVETEQSPLGIKQDSLNYHALLLARGVEP